MLCRGRSDGHWHTSPPLPRPGEPLARQQGLAGLRDRLDQKMEQLAEP